MHEDINFVPSRATELLNFNNTINTLLIRLDIILCCSESLNIYEIFMFDMLDLSIE